MWLRSVIWRCFLLLRVSSILSPLDGSSLPGLLLWPLWVLLGFVRPVCFVFGFVYLLFTASMKISISVAFCLDWGVAS